MNKRGVRYLSIILSLVMIAMLAYVVYAGISSVTQTSPTDETISFYNHSLYFNCTVAAPEGDYIANVTLWTNSTGTWVANVTNSSAVGPGDGGNAYANLSVEHLPDTSDMLWACYAEADDSGGAWSGNYTITVDTELPTVFNWTNLTYGDQASVYVNNTISANRTPQFNWNMSSDRTFTNYTFFISTDENFDVSDYYFELAGADNTTFEIGVTDTTGLGGILAENTVYYMFVTAYENSGAEEYRAGEINVSDGYWQYTTDNSDPVVYMLNPTNASWSSNAIDFEYNASDVTLDACTLNTNVSGSWAVNDTNLTLTAPDDSTTIPLYIHDGSYIWNVTCNDSAANYGDYLFDTNFIVYVDGTAPTGLYLGNATPNETITSDTTPTLNWSVATEVNLVNYTLELGLYVDFSDLNYTNYTTVHDAAVNQHTITGFTPVDGDTYYWRVSVWDSAGNSLTTGAHTFTIDTTAPSLTLVAPTNNTWSTSSTVNFKVSVTETNLQSCTIYMSNITGSADANAWAANMSNLSNVIDGEFDILVPELVDTTADDSDSYYVWNALCTDNASNDGWMSVNYTVKIDTGYPEKMGVNGLAGNYSNGTIMSTLTPTLNISSKTNVNATNFANYTLDIDNDDDFSSITYTAANTSQATTANDNESYHLVTTSLNTSTYYYWRVTSWDDAGNSVSGDVGYFGVDNVAPEILNVSYESSEYLDSSNGFINFTVYDFAPNECHFYLVNSTDTSWTAGGEWNETWLLNTSYVYANNTALTWNFTLADGTYTWNIWCNDTAMDSNNADWQAAANNTLYVETTVPEIVVFYANNSQNMISMTFNDIDATVGVNTSSLAVTVDGATSNFNYSSDCDAYSVTGATGYKIVNCTWIETVLDVTTAGDTSTIAVTGKSMSRVSGSTSVLVHTNAARNHSVSLVAGWNLVSTPLILQDSTIEIIKANNSLITDIQYYNGTTGGWHTWSSTASDTMTTIEPRKGYWIKTTAATTLYLFGNYSAAAALPYTGLPLVAGWFTIGSYTDTGNDDLNTSVMLAELLDGATIDFTKLMYWDASNTAYIDAYKSTNPQSSAWETDKVWDRSIGFWIYMTTSATFR